MKRFTTLILFCVFLSACTSPKKILFVASDSIHLWADHEHAIMCEQFSEFVNTSMKTKATASWILYNDDDFNFDTAKDFDAIVIITEGEDYHPFKSKSNLLKELNQSGVNFGVFHYALMFNDDDDNDVLDYIVGGHYQKGYSHNPFFTAHFDTSKDIDILNGVDNFDLYSELHFNIKFSQNPEQKITPILQTLVPDNLRKNRTLHKTIQEQIGKNHLETITWTVENPNGTRGLGTTFGHFIFNLENDNYRKTMLNAFAWLLEIDIAQNGFDSQAWTKEKVSSKITKKPRADYIYYMKRF